jgi:hypothetical protein
MTVTLNLPPNIEQLYLAEARARGLAVEEVMAQTLVAARQHAADEEVNPDEWIRRFKAWAHSHDHENLPVLSDEAVSRDSMYD